MNLSIVLSLFSLLFGSGVLVSVCRYFSVRLKAAERENEAIKMGVQALLRDRLISEYNDRNEKGFAPIYAKENFENMWKHYHNLGKNGVMDGVHNDFMALPTEPPTKGEVNNEQSKD